ncbi:hypothetical protein FHG87_017618 [Trinorchestia longiramus]|nr:hypothetical protein FHG87_017618 [Trinorchestia longiramus]
MTSGQPGDKKETHDSLLDAGMPLKEEDSVVSDSISVVNDSISSSSKQETVEYTYDKAIEGYKQYAQTSAKKRTASLNNLASLDKTISNTGTPAGNINNKLDFFVKEMDKEFVKPSPKPTVRMRDQNPKVDITKRRTMFEMSQSTSTINMSTGVDTSRLDRRRSSDMTASAGNLRNKVASFETIDTAEDKSKATVTPPKDTKFKEKLANFSSMNTEGYTPSRKKTPEKDKNFFQKLASFSSLESREETHQVENKTAPFPQITTKTLRSKIASFEQLDQQDQFSDLRLENRQNKERSVSMESLAKLPSKKLEVNSPTINDITQTIDENGTRVQGVTSKVDDGMSKLDGKVSKVDNTTLKIGSDGQVVDHKTHVLNTAKSVNYAGVTDFAVSAVNKTVVIVDKIPKIVGKTPKADRKVEKIGSKSPTIFDKTPMPACRSLALDCETSIGDTNLMFSPKTLTIGGKTPALDPKIPTMGGKTPALDPKTQTTEVGSNPNKVDTLTRYTPYIDVSLGNESVPLRSGEPRTNYDSQKRVTIYETFESVQMTPDVESAAMYSIFKAEKGHCGNIEDESRLRKSSVDVLAEEASEEISSSITTKNTFNSTSSTVKEDSSFLQKDNSSAMNETLTSRNDTNFLGNRSALNRNENSSLSKSSLPSRTEVTFSRNDVISSRNDVTSSRNDLTSSRNDITSSRNDVTSSKNEITSLNDISSSRNETSSLRSDTHFVQTDSFSTRRDQVSSMQQTENATQDSACPPLDLQGAIASSEAPISTSSPRSVAEKDAYSAAKIAGDRETIYDDVLNTAQPAFSLSETTMQAYTDDDINQAINYSSPHVAGVTQSSTVTSVSTSKVGSSPTKRQLPTVPPTPYKPPTSAISSVKAPSPVVFVDWSSNGGPIAPPTEPPPPPPPEEGESDEDVAPPPSDSWGRSDGVSFDQSAGSPTPSDTPSVGHSEASSRTSTSTREELRRRRSNFLGTSSDMAAPSSTENLLQRQQQESDRKLLEARRSLQQSTAQVLSDIDQSQSARQQSLQSSKSYDSSSNRNRYTWEDRLRADTSSQPDNLNDTDDGYNYHNKLEELEAEMLRHDRTVISRTMSQQQQQQQQQQQYADNATYDDVAPPTNVLREDTANNYKNSTSTYEHSSSTVNYHTEIYHQSSSNGGYQQDNGRYQQEAESTEHSSHAMDHDAVDYRQDSKDFGSHPSEGYRQDHDSRSRGSYPGNGYHQDRDGSDSGLHQVDPVSLFAAPEKPLRTYNTCYDSAAPQQQTPPEPLPRKLLPQVPKENRPEPLPASAAVPQMSKQSRQALSATPRNRLSHGESWIKRKPEAARDYSKHWVMQEAEQRRLEQQSRPNKRDQKPISGGTSGFSPMTKSFSNSSLGSSSFVPQNLNSGDPQYRSTDIALNRALDPSSRTGDLSNRFTDSRIESRPVEAQVATTRAMPPPINRTTDPNSWRDQATTYQPLPPPAAGPRKQHKPTSHDKGTELPCLFNAPSSRSRNTFHI